MQNRGFYSGPMDDKKSYKALDDETSDEEHEMNQLTQKSKDNLGQ